MLYYQYNVKEPIMSTLHHESILETLYEEVLEEYPQYDEEQCEAIAKARFEEVCQ